MRDAIYRSFSLIVLVSLAMAWVISTNCSSMDVMYIVITSIVIVKEEVKESEWLKELFSFYILIGDLKCESVLELASTIEEGNLFLESFIMENCFSLP